MKERLNKAEKNILDRLDKILAGQNPGEPATFLEEKLWQTLKKFECVLARLPDVWRSAVLRIAAYIPSFGII